MPNPRNHARELRIIASAKSGKSARAIAEVEGISRRTVTATLDRWAFKSKRGRQPLPIADVDRPFYRKLRDGFGAVEARRMLGLSA